MTPLLGFTPDRDPTQPGVITDCTNLVPTEIGMEAAPSPVSPAGIGPLAAACRGAAVLTLLSGARRIFAGTSTKLYELSGTTWNDVSRGASYTGSVDARWSFAQFGNASLASDDNAPIQASVSSGAFADIAGAPVARIVIAVGNFVLAFNTVDGTYGDSPDRWRCSAFQNHADWAVSVSTQANTGRLVGGGGEIVGAIALGEQAIAFKPRAIFVGQYVGSPVVWQWSQVPGDVGLVGPEAVVDIGGALVGVGEENVWMFDGTRPVPIDDDVRAWLYRELSQTYRYRTKVAFDRQLGRVWIFFPSSASSGEVDRALVYNLRSRRWGRADRVIEAVLANYAAPGLTWDSIGSVYSTWDSLPDIPYDSQFWLAGGRVFSIFDSAHQVQNMVGASTGCSLTTGDFGDDSQASMLTRARLRFLREPTSGSVAGRTKAGAGATLVTGGAGVLSDARFDLRQKGRWHRLSFDLVGPCHMNGVEADLKRTGTR